MFSSNKNICFENLNISTNNIIEVEDSKILPYKYIAIGVDIQHLFDCRLIATIVSFDFDTY
jgi:hypothetical protein